MFPICGQLLPPRLLAVRLRLVPVVACALVVTASIAGCGGDSGPEGASASRTADAAPPGTTRPTPLDDGELIVFERVVPGSEQRDLYAVGPEGGEPRLIRSPGDYPHWAPDSSALVFLGCLNPPDCTTAFALLERSTGEVHGFPMPEPELFTACATWAPSGTELACAGLSENAPERNGVYTIRVSDGRGLTRLTSNRGGEDFPLAFSPDGTRLLFDRMDPSRGGTSDHALFVASVGGGRPHRVTPWGFADDFADWSPDGRTIVFGTNGSLYRVSPGGKGLSKIELTRADGTPAENAFDVGFSPDGARIVFSLGSPAPGLYTARPDGSDVQQLTAGEDHHASWGAAAGS
jgi:tricorn protease-like protein